MFLTKDLMPLVDPLRPPRLHLMHLIPEALRNGWSSIHEAVFLSHDGSSLENQDGHSRLPGTEAPVEAALLA